MADVVVCEWLPKGELTRLSAALDVAYEPDLFADPSRLLTSVSRTRGIIVRNKTRITPEVIAAAPNLEIIGRLGAGLDNIDTAAAAAAGVDVVPAVGVNAASVAEYVFGAMVVLLRPVFGLTDAMTRGEWPRHGHTFGRELAGKTLGLIGLGAIGQAVAKRAAAFGMTVIANDPYLVSGDPAWQLAAPTALDELVAHADVLSVHVAFTPETRRLLDARRITAMKPTAILINTSRGATVDQAAVAAALRSGRLAGAALDVFDNEPLDANRGADFAGLDNVLLTPHVSGNTEESVARVSKTIVDAVLTALA